MVSDPVVRIALLTAGSALAVSLLLVLLVVGVRLWRRQREQHEARLVGAWRPYLFAALAGSSEPAPFIAAADVPTFLTLWNHLQESTRGSATQHLNDAFIRAGLLPQVLSLLRSRRHSDRLLACTALGHLRHGSAWEPLLELAQDSHPILSFVAAKALLRMDAEPAMKILMKPIAERNDWPVARMALVFRELGANAVTPHLEAALFRAKGQSLPRLLQLATLAHREPMVRAIRSWIKDVSEVEVLASALEFLTYPEDIPLLRGASRHADSRVRLAAAKALGVVGSASEKALLLDLMRDSSWWVRYRAAESLLKLPGITEEEISALYHGAKDRFAADMLHQIWVERQPT